MPDNAITIVGNATRDPELRFTPSGQAVVAFGVACNRKWTDRDTGEKKEDVSFFDVTAWGQFAENVAESIQKGNRVVVTGRLQQRSWETNDGEKRSKVEINADSIGPDLRWATASVRRNERQAGGGFEGTGATERSRPASRDDFASDEKPF